MTAERPPLARSTPDRIEVRGFDLTADLMGKIDLGEMAFLELLGRLPSDGESMVFNAMLVALVEHGITPSTLATRLTHLGAPESLQGAVAAGILGLGNTFVGSIEGAARILQEAIPLVPESGDVSESVPPDYEALAASIVADYRARRVPIPGIGHPIHRAGDPRATRLFQLAADHALSGSHVELMHFVAREAETRSGRTLPINATGAIGAIASDMGIPWQICRGLGLMARSVGLVAHLLEEMREPIAGDVWRLGEQTAEQSPAADTAGRARGMYANLAPGRSLVDELIAERRQEAQREDEES